MFLYYTQTFQCVSYELEMLSNFNEKLCFTRCIRVFIASPNCKYVPTIIYVNNFIFSLFARVIQRAENVMGFSLNVFIHAPCGFRKVHLRLWTKIALAPSIGTQSGPLIFIIDPPSPTVDINNNLS